MQTPMIASDGLAIGIPVQESSNALNSFKSWYIFKVLNLVLAQLFVTMIISIISYCNKDAWLDYYSKDVGLLILPMVFSFGSLIALSCYKLDRTLRGILFGIFTLSMAMFLSIIILPYSPKTLVQALAATITCVLCINSYAYYTAKKNMELSLFRPALLGGLCGLIVLSIIQIFVQSSIMALFIGIVGSGLFSVYLLYDLNKLYNRVDEFERDPLIVAIDIYLDIINMFLYMLEFIRECTRD